MERNHVRSDQRGHGVDRLRALMARMAVTAYTVLLVTEAMAHGGDHGGGYGGRMPDRGTARTEDRSSVRSRVPIPASLPEVWAAVRASREAMDPVISSRNWYDVDDLTVSIRELVAAMPEKTAMLSGERMGDLKDAVKVVKRLTLRLHDVSDDGHARKIPKVLAKLDRALKNVEALYPAGTLASVPSAPIAVVYRCPMHPEITSVTPGRCSQCGMDLVAKK